MRTGTGGGMVAAQGRHQWQLNGVTLISDGAGAATEGALELAGCSYNGRMLATT